MATQKKYHDLVILDSQITGTKPISTKKLVSGILFFLIGVFIGAFLVSVLNNKSSNFTQVVPAVTNPSPVNNSQITPITNELQSITSITAAPEDSGCGIESLGRNSIEGCSADAFTDTPLETTDANSTDITDLSFSDTVEDAPSDNNSTPASELGVTNILDLQ